MNNRWAAFFIAVLFLLVLLGLFATLLSYTYPYGLPFGYAGMGSMMIGMMFIGPVIGLLFLFALVYIVAFGLRCWPGVEKESAMDALKMRYAKGEIAKKEFEEMRKAIEK